MQREQRLIKIPSDGIIRIPIMCGENTVGEKRIDLSSYPTVDAVEVEDPELMKAIKLLVKQYSHSKASDYVYNPIAHALYHTWKQVDERKDK